ncbi:MAG: carboxypeptidase regulatory-like domain-containing protein [Candidatus Thermoplasmatota archaeon]|nr:carboxypeptidase regulatory-like domain-containing protein [Candidatus Thermoplasmatota archaeon]
MDEDESAQIMGIPLYILIIVIIATISLAAIMGFMVTRDASIERVEIEDVEIDGERKEEIICDDERDDGTAYYRGVEREAENGSGTVGPDSGYDGNLTITVYDENGNEMPGVDVKATGPGVEAVGTTNVSGQVELSLEGLHLPPGEENDKITVEATAEGFIGDETASETIWVKRG